MLILTLIVIVALAALGGYFFGVRRRAPLPSLPPVATPVAAADPPQAPEPGNNVAPTRVDSEKARLVRSLSGEAFALRGRLDIQDAPSGDLVQARATIAELDASIAAAREETARFRQMVVDIENNAPPRILLGSNEPDDLKLIVGIGPVLERMLQQLGINSYRQIARWTDRDIDEFNARLPDFPGRIRRDAWVTQARALHQSKYGESLPSRERG